MRKHSPYCAGIDLGTSNSSISTLRLERGQLRAVTKSVQRKVSANGLRSDPLLPSYVFYFKDRTNGEYVPIVGDYAKEMYASMPYVVAKSIKSQMGQNELTGLSPDIPDKKPEEVSARIILTLLNDLKKHLGEEVKDAVITVPASFDSAQRYATLRAAELARLEVRDDYGQFDQDVLLSEPEAVMYYLLNEIKNDACDALLDFSTPKKVMIFDIGGGTLDITLHIIKTNSENPDLLDMQLLATNRYTPVAGDTFDRFVAEAMYEQFLSTYRVQSPAMVRSIDEKREQIIADLLSKAEELKFNLNSAVEDAVICGREVDPNMDFSCGGYIASTGTQYAGYFTKAEYERAIEPLLGRGYKYDDYKTIESHDQTRDIIWPVLDVLRKAAKQLGVTDIVPDKVIMSGGMSKLYIIRDRLQEFFGMNIISVPDPDLAVTKGAVIYHSHLHNNISEGTNAGSERMPHIQPALISKSSSVLGDSLYLGLSRGATSLLADEGQELPYSSPLLDKFEIEAGQNIVVVPIKKKGVHAGEYITMASGNIVFDSALSYPAKMAIRFHIDKNQLITIDAFRETRPNNKGTVTTQHGTVSFILGEIDKKGIRAPKVRVTDGKEKLVPSNEISGLIDLLKSKNRDKEKIKSAKSSIINCANPEDFAEQTLKAIRQYSSSSDFCQNLIPVARKLSAYWTDAEVSELMSICLTILSPLLKGYALNEKQWNSTFGECILTIGMRGEKDILEEFYNLDLHRKYTNVLIHSYALRGIHADLIADLIYDENHKEAMRWVGLAIKNSESMPIDFDFDDLAKKLCSYLNVNETNMGTLTNCIISLGMICAKSSKYADEILDFTRNMVKNAIMTISGAHEEVATPANVALKLISGSTLEEEEEKYLMHLFES